MRYQGTHRHQFLVPVSNVMEVKLEADPVHLRLALLAGVELVKLPHHLLPLAVVEELVLVHGLPHGQPVSDLDAVDVCPDERRDDSQVEVLQVEDGGLPALPRHQPADLLLVQRLRLRLRPPEDLTV